MSGEVIQMDELLERFGARFGVLAESKVIALNTDIAVGRPCFAAVLARRG